MKYANVEDYYNAVINDNRVKSLYPVKIKNNLMDGNIQDIYKYFNELTKKGKLRKCYEVRCNICSHIIGVYEMATDIPELLDCNACNETDMEKEDSIVNIVYKVTRD